MKKSNMSTVFRSRFLRNMALDAPSMFAAPSKRRFSATSDLRKTARVQRKAAL